MTEKKQPKRGRPPTGETPRRTIRIGNRTWAAAKKKAKKEGRTVTRVVIDLLMGWLKK